MTAGPVVELQCITMGEHQETAYFLLKDSLRVMETDHAMMEILSKVMPYKVCPCLSMIVDWIAGASVGITNNCTVPHQRTDRLPRV